MVHPWSGFIGAGGAPLPPRHDSSPESVRSLSPFKTRQEEMEEARRRQQGRGRRLRSSSSERSRAHRESLQHRQHDRSRSPGERSSPIRRGRGHRKERGWESRGIFGYPSSIRARNQETSRDRSRSNDFRARSGDQQDQRSERNRPQNSGIRSISPPPGIARYPEYASKSSGSNHHPPHRRSVKTAGEKHSHRRRSSPQQHTSRRLRTPSPEVFGVSDDEETIQLVPQPPASQSGTARMSPELVVSHIYAALKAEDKERAAIVEELKRARQHLAALKRAKEIGMEHLHERQLEKEKEEAHSGRAQEGKRRESRGAEERRARQATEQPSGSGPILGSGDDSQHVGRRVPSLVDLTGGDDDDDVIVLN